MQEAEVCSYENDKPAVHNLLKPFSSNKKILTEKQALLLFCVNLNSLKPFYCNSDLIIDDWKHIISIELHSGSDIEVMITTKIQIAEVYKDSISDTICFWGNQT